MARMSSDLLTDIRVFLQHTNMGPSYFGKAACGNSELVTRLVKGGRIWPDTEAKIRAFMRQHRAENRRRAA